MGNAFSDPLAQFDWQNLGVAYNKLARRYDPNSPYLASLSPGPSSEQGLYRLLVHRFATEKLMGIDAGTYQAMLYWKLYSQPASLATNCRPLSTEPEQSNAQAALKAITAELNPRLPQYGDVNSVLELFDLFGPFRLHGTKSCSALPVRATFLHFFFPEVVPLFDKQVLMAAGLTKEDADEGKGRKDTLSQYIPFAWELAKRYGHRLPTRWPETPLRLIDMALWVHRGRN